MSDRGVFITSASVSSPSVVTVCLTLINVKSVGEGSGKVIRNQYPGPDHHQS